MSEFESVVDEIFEALNGKVNKKEISRELRNLVTMSVPISEARRSVISKYGGSILKISGEIKKVAELGPNEGHINLQVRIMSINPKEFDVDGEKKMMYYGTMGDESGTVPFTAWHLDQNLRRGDCVSVKNAYTREWQGRTKVMFGQNTVIELLSSDSVKVKNTYHPAKIIELHPGMGLVEVVGKILSVDNRTVNVDGTDKRVYSGILGDESGQIPYSAWGVEVKKNEVLKISGAYVSSFRGMPQLVFDSRSTVEKVNKSIEIQEKTVNLDSLEGKGGFNSLIEGIIIEVKDGSGLVYRCPECRRVVNRMMCPVHGRVEPVPDMRIKAILDDGTGAVMCMFNREQTERVLGFDIEEAIKRIKDNIGNPAIINDTIEEKLIARPLRVRGNVMSDEKYGLRMFVNDFEFVKIEDIAKKAEMILEELGW